MLTVLDLTPSSAITVRDGLIAALDVYYKNPSAVAALFG